MKTIFLKTALLAIVLAITTNVDAQTDKTVNTEYRTTNLANGNINTTWNGKRYQIKLTDNKMTTLNVDGKDIPADKWGEYSQATKEILEQFEKDMIQAKKDMERARLDMIQAEKDMVQANKDMEQARIDMVQAGKDHQQAEKDIIQAKLDVEQAAKDRVVHSKDIEQAKKDIERARLDLIQAQKNIVEAKKNIEQTLRDSVKTQADKKKYPNGIIKKSKNEKK